MNKISVKDDFVTLLVKLSAGNPGAATCLTEFADATKQHPLIFAEGLRMFGSLGLYGSQLYILWNDCLARSTGALRELVLAWVEARVEDGEILEAVKGDGCRGTPLLIHRRVWYE